MRSSGCKLQPAHVSQVKDYRTARQVLLDAEAAMQKTIDADKSRWRRWLHGMTEERNAALADAANKAATIEFLRAEMEVRHSFLCFSLSFAWFVELSCVLRDYHYS